MSLTQTDLKIGANPVAKTASAVFELESTTKEFLMPCMPDVQMTAVATLANGLQVYNTTFNCVYACVTNTKTNKKLEYNGLTKTGINIQLGDALLKGKKRCATHVFNGSKLMAQSSKLKAQN